MCHRQLFTIAIFAAILVGCAASAMHFGSPVPAVASKTVMHVVKPLTVTGPCYKPNGNDCASTYHVVNGIATFQVQSCASLTKCTPGTSGDDFITFYGNAVFTKVPACYSSPGADAYIATADPRGSDLSVEIEVFNASASTTPTQTVSFSFQCAGP